MSDRLKIRLERITLLIGRGYTGDIKTGKVYNKHGKEVRTKHSLGYLAVGCGDDNGQVFNIKQHQFIWFLAYNTLVDNIDHINGIKTDNRISNLRTVTSQQNQFNSKAKGYSWSKQSGKWHAQIMIDGKQINLGFYDIEKDARQAYLDGKLKYHNI